MSEKEKSSGVFEENRIIYFKGEFTEDAAQNMVEKLLTFEVEDEETAILSGTASGKWEVSGKGEATIYHAAAATKRYEDGAVFSFPG